MIPDKLSKMGVTSQCSIVYSKAAYVCIEVSLTNLDLYKLLAFNSSPARADHIMFLLDRFGLPALTDFISKWMLGFLMNRLMVVFPANIKEKLFNRFAAELEIINCSEEEQGGFLLQTMNALDSNNEARPGVPTGGDAGEASAGSVSVDSPLSSQPRSVSVGAT
ncbi:hypothetical protein EON65_10120 [archaeon]|nr:MAG: hypothetical protein EON65_10120 [archaeon]